MKPVGANDSRADLPTPTSPSNDGGSSGSLKRRRTATGTSSRGVANLTPEQLEKKRANDREAQRAIRERTKTTIETLEKEIAQLKAQHPYQELQHALHQKDLIQAENEDIRRQLTSAMTILSPILQERRANGQPIAPFVDSASLPQALRGSPLYQASRSGLTVHSPPANLGTPTSAVADNASCTSLPSPSTVQTESARRTPWQTPGEPHATAIAHRHSPSGSFDHAPRTIPVPGERLHLDFLLDGSQHTHTQAHASEIGTPIGQTGTHPRSDHSSIHSPGLSAGSTGPPSHLPEWAAHATPVRNIGPTCPLDILLLDFLSERRTLAANGISEQDLIGPRYPSITALMYPERSHQSHPTSKVFTDILSKFPDLSTLPEQIAVLYVMFLVMRWEISPTQENYDRLPDWVTPRASQLFTPHPAWIDHLPWPRMRDTLVREHPSYPFDEFFIPFTTTVSLNWPYNPTDTLISSSESDEVTINPVFERHLRNLNNWSLGPAFANAHPKLVDSVRIQPTGTG
ncbi:MAG: hypothetical protein M4579_004634 [Chaenotheca gracillima]|nr:MAG: hypothetical protein M4579_004634 [Chaenotheca gracillima]